MLESKRRRLRAAGWGVGTPAEFLELPAADAAYIELRLRLADGFRLLRRKRRLTQHGLARALGSSQSRIAKMEAGDPTVSLDLLITGLLSLGATRADLARLITGRRGSTAA